MMLDATAGNRMMWHTKNPPNTVFLDKEMRLARPPTIFGDFRKTPFRDDVFDCVIFDPPHFARSTPPPWYNDPTDEGKWYGIPKTKTEVMSNLHKAQKEFQRLTKRICLQWYDNYPRDMSLGQALVFFKDWKIIQKMQRIHGSKKKRKSKTWWVTMIRTSCQPSNNQKDGFD